MTENFSDKYLEALEGANRVPLLFLKDKLSALDQTNVRFWGRGGSLIYSYPCKKEIFAQKSPCFATYASIAFYSICDAFDIPQKEQAAFLASLLQVGGGKGNEMANLSLTHLTSSALCALLFFYRIGPSSPFVYEGVAYTKAEFEFEIPAIFPGRPACIDVMLFDKDKTNALAIECKFSEYTSLKRKKIRNGVFLQNNYQNWFSLGTNEPTEFEKTFFVQGEELCCYGLHYLSGIKQVFSHVYALWGIGQTSFPGLEEVKFREVAFDFGPNDEDGDLDAFRDDYRIAISHIKEKRPDILQRSHDGVRLDIGDEIVTFQELFKGQEHLLLDRVSLFYGISKSEQ